MLTINIIWACVVLLIARMFMPEQVKDPIQREWNNCIDGFVTFAELMNYLKDYEETIENYEVKVIAQGEDKSAGPDNFRYTTTVFTSDDAWYTCYDESLYHSFHKGDIIPLTFKPSEDETTS